jgi:hypothetical protein
VSAWSWRQRHAVEELLKQRRVGAPKEAPGRGGAVWPATVIVVHGGEGGELARTEAVAAMVKQRQVANAACRCWAKSGGRPGGWGRCA